jgi:hypothetical protein
MASPHLGQHCRSYAYARLDNFIIRNNADAYDYCGICNTKRPAGKPGGGWEVMGDSLAALMIGSTGGVSFICPDE